MNLSNYFSALTMLAALTLSLPARADIAPDDQCSASVLGQACSNATKDGAESLPGVCKQAMCSRATPDGPMTYACFRCEVVEQGMGGQPNEASGAGAGSDSDVGGSPTAGAPTHSPGGTSAGGTPNGSAGAGTAGTKAGSGGVASDTKTSDDGGGCSVSQARGGAGLGAALAALGVLVAGLRRRRSLAS